MTGLTGSIRSAEGWPVPNAVLTVTDMRGGQIARAVADDSGRVGTDPLPAGMHTAVVTAAGYQPAARVAQIAGSGSGSLGTVELVAVAEAVELPAAGAWTIDPVHSSLMATARHLGISSIKARFPEVSGRLEVVEPFERSTGYAEIKAAGIDTGNAMRDNHLRSSDFLDVERFPLIRFTLGGIRRTGSDTWAMTGDLALHGEQRTVDLDVTYGGAGADPWGGTRAAFHVETLLHREEFAIDYSALARAGVAAIGTTVKLDLDIQVVQGDRLPEM